MPRATDEQLLEVCRLCISYLYDKHSTEIGLFRSSVAQTDVRALQAQIIQFGQNKFRDDPDPHLVAEVMQTSFKNLTYPLLHEVYQDIVHTDLDDDDLDLSESSIQSWIVKLPKVKFHLTSALFRLLARLAGSDESDSNLIQLAYCIAPTICRPMNSAYMSIRHMEDLRKIRPVISFIMENYDEIFTEDIGPSSPIKAYNSARDLGGVGSFSFDKNEDISNMMSSAMVIDAGTYRSAGGDGDSFAKDDASMSSMEESVDDLPHETKGETPELNLSPRSLGLIRPNLKLTIPPPNMPQQSFPPVSYDTSPHMATSPSSITSGSLLGSSTDNDSSSSSSGLAHYTDLEWTILETLLLQTTSSYLDFDGVPRGEPMQVSDSISVGSQSSNPSRQGAPSVMSPPSSSSAAQNGTGPAGAETPSGGTSGSGVTGSGNKQRRRKMVADCKAMRVQIFEFEQEWTRKHNRIPKSFERGAMESVYTRYRKLKKEIRDLSATDLQRAIRGYLSRKRYGRVGPIRWGNSSGPLDKSATAPGKSAGGHSATKRADYSQNFFTPPSGTSAGAGAGAGAAGGAHDPNGLYAAYREVLEKKRELKRRLKKFDEDFFENWGRNPKKSDKEVIRPLYQQYHEIKAKLDEMRLAIESSHGPLPEDLQEDARGSGSTSGAPSPAITHSESTNAGAMDTSAAAKYASDDEDLGNKASYKGSPGVGAGSGPSGGGRYLADSGEPKGYQFSVNKNTINVESELEALQIEKRNLHAYLKVYERDFSRMHGRPVTKHADIQPVAHEYQRYKELKNLIREKKNQVTGAK